jgi:PAS domain S-box-containing protein
MKNLSVSPSRPADAGLAAALDLTGEPLVTTDGSGAITWHNAPFTLATGHAPGATLGRLLLPLLGGEHTDGALQRQMQAAIENGEDFGPLEVLHHRADGSAFCNQIRARHLDATADAPEQFVFAMRDVSELRHLRHENARLAELLDRTRDLGNMGVWERDHHSGFGRWDRNMRRFFEIGEGQPVPPLEEVAQQMHADDRDRVLRRLALREPGHYSERYRVVRPGGRMRRIQSAWEVKGSPAEDVHYSVGILVDETETWDLVESLNETNERLRLALEIAHIAVWRHDQKSGLVQFDERGSKMLDIDVPDDGIAYEALGELLHPDDVHRVNEAAQAALQSTGHVDIEARYRRTDGSYRYLLTRRVVERNVHGAPLAFVGVALDVTEQVEGSRKASALARQLDATASAAGIGLWSVDTTTGEATWNAQVWTLFGLRPQASPPPFDDWVEAAVHPDDRLRVRAESQLWFDPTRREIDSDFRVVLPDGQVRWLVGRARRESGAAGTGTIWRGVTWDVTERRAAQEALREAYERAALTASGAGIGTWERDLVKGTVWWDEQMCRMRGLEPRATVDGHAERMASIHPDDRPGVAAQHARALQGGEPVAYEFRALLPDGSLRWIASRTLGVRSEKGELVRLIGVNWDITAEKEAELVRQERAVALRESRAKSEFLARMSHELRTPLNAVLGFTQLLQAEDDGSVPARSAKLQHIRTGGEHLLALINEVLDLARLESDQLRLDITSVAVEEVAGEALAMVESLAAAHGVVLEASELEGMVMVDRTRLRQVLINLLSNAIKFNRPHGRVSLRCSQLGTRVAVSVKDTGRGMSREQVSHLFEPFNRLGAEREGIEGTGIGLVIVKVIVERMGGELRVVSQPDEGSTFEVRLKSADAAASEPMKVSAAMPLDHGTAPPASGRGRLLYIEDNPVNVLLVKEVVAQRPALELVCEIDGGSGIARAVAMLPDLILVDMQLPDMDGHGVLQQLRANPRTAQIPCIALSANVLTQDIERALAAGFSDYWTKPIDLPAFLASLDALFGRLAPR